MTGREPAPPVSQHTPEDKGLPVLPPLSALAEIVILFALIYGIDRLTPNLAILDLSPHPFWIPVLLVSLQYGTVSGFIAAAAATALSLFSGMPEQDIGENLFAYFLRVLGQPILWIGVALLVGQFRMRQLAAKQELRHANRALTVQRDDLARHAHQLRARVAHLEQELSTRYGAPPHAIAATLAETMAAGGLREDADEQAVLQSAAAGLFPEAVIAAYRLRNGMLAECAASGRRPDSGPRIRITQDDALFRAVIGEGRSVSVLSRAGEVLMAETGLAAVPIPGDTEVQTAAAATPGVAASPPYGMLVIERAPPDTITPDGMRALEMLAHALSPRQRRPLIEDAEHGLIPPRRLRQPTDRLARRIAEKAGKATPPAARPAQDRRTGLIERLKKHPDTGTPATVSISTPAAANSGTDAGRTPRAVDPAAVEATKSVGDP